MFKIFVSDSMSEAAINEIKKQKDCEVTVDTGLPEEELVKKIPGYDALIVRSATQVTAKIIAAGKDLKIIGRAGAGTDNIDRAAASAQGILVVNAPTGNLTSVAELVFGHILSAMRRLPLADSSTKAGKWEKKKLDKLGHEIDGKTLGIIGLGKIGQLVAQRAHGFNLKVIAYDPVTTSEIAESVGAELVDLESLLKSADIVTLHVPLIPQTKHLISTKQLALMKKTAMLINCARGGVVDEAALATWLSEHSTALAALDTFEKEPIDPAHPLLQLENFFATPHIGASTAEAQEKVGLQLIDQVVRALRGEIVEFIVNLPFRAGGGLPEQKAWNELAEKLGRLAAQLLAGDSLKKAELTIAGEIAAHDTKMPQVSTLKGLLEALSDDTDVNFINATALAEKKGIKLEVKEDKTGAKHYRNKLILKLKAGKREIEVRGTLLEGSPRITFIQGFRTDFAPGKHLLLTRHNDKPGIIGRVGTMLGDKKVNIASMNLGREKVGGEALMILELDETVSEEVLKELRGWKDFEEVLRVDL